MNEGLISSDIFRRSSDSGVMEGINDVDLGLLKCDMDSTRVNAVDTLNSSLGLVNIDSSVVVSDKKRQVDMVLNEMDNERNELNIEDSVRVDGEGLGVHRAEIGLFGSGNISYGIDSVSSDVGCDTDLSGVSLELKIEDYNVETVVTSGLRKRLECASEKERNSRITIDVIDNPDIQITDKMKKEMDLDEVGYVKDLLGFSLEEKVEDYEEAYSKTNVLTSGLGECLEIVSDKERNLDSTIMVQIDVNDNPIFDTIKKELDLVSNEVGFVRDPVGVSVEENIESYEETDRNTINITSGPVKKFESVSWEKRNSESTFHGKNYVNDDHDIDTIVWKRRRGRQSEKRKEERDVEKEVRVSAGDYAHVKIVADTSGPKKKRTETLTFMKKVDIKDDPTRDIIFQRRDRGRSSKERYVKSDIEEKDRVSAGDYANHESVAGTTGPRIKLENLPKKKGKRVSTFKKRTEVDEHSDVEVIVPQKRRGLPKERKFEGIVEEKLRVRSCVKKSGYVDNSGDEEKDKKTAVDVSASSLQREKGERKNELDYSELMECGEDKQKAEKGGRVKKRKMMEISVQKLDNGACKKKAKETSFDEETEGVSRNLVRCDMKTKKDILSYKHTEKTRDESTHLPKKEKLEGIRGRPLKGQGKGESFRTIDSHKQKKHALKKIGLCVLSKKDIMGSNFEDTSDGEGKKIILEQPTKKNREEKEEGKRRSTQKQLIKIRIKDMLVNAGWRIEHRPRNGKENVYDSVYVCPKGRGYWSVTRAYQTLKREVENGDADSKAVSVFVPIAEDEWNSLLKIPKKKSGLEKNSNKRKVISQKKVLKKKHAKEKLKKSNGKERKNKKKLALLARGSKKGLDLNGENFLTHAGRLSLFSWMIDLGTLPLGVKVKTLNTRNTNVLLEGKVTENGIHCDCCSKKFDLADFDFHSGNSPGQPLQNLFLDDNISLLQCLQDSWTKYEESMKLGYHYIDIDGEDPNDDTCNMCGDGGNLICCDSCPSAIHKKCLNLQHFPSGDWNCHYCSCKFCGLVDKHSHDEDHNCDASAPALPTCRLCEEKYHLRCIQGKNAANDEPNFPTFCGQKCQEIFYKLEVLLGVRHEMEGYSWTLIQHSDGNLDKSSLSSAKKVECNAKLAVAWSIMDECFLPIVHRRSAINMIRNVVFSCGSNFRRLSYTGFFIAILEKGDEIISVASLRIHGNLLAEMPFIGTRHAYRRQGMCRRLLNAIETALSSLNVEKLVLPAIPELQQTWTSVFGFMPLEDSHKEEMKYMNMIAFPGVDMLQKPVVKPLIGIKNLSSPTDKSGGTADVATVCILTSRLSNLSSNEPSDMSFELANCQDYISSNDSIDKEYVIAPSKDASQIGNCRDPDESNNPANVPLNCMMKNHHSSDVKEISDCELNGEVSAINPSRDQRVLSNHGASTRALVLV